MIYDEKNRVKIICNPYVKEIKYLWYDQTKKSFKKLNSNSKFENKYYKCTTIQKRASDIIKILNDHYKNNKGIEIDFVGTSVDYDDLCEVIKTRFPKCNIECKKDDEYYETAEKVMPKIQEKFKKVKNILAQYKEEIIKKEIDKYNEVIDASVSICVVGLYSSEKSMFINSLIGEEILPVDDDLEIAGIYKVTNSNKYQIKFMFGQEKCTLEFEGKFYKLDCNGGWDINTKLQKIIEENDNHNEIYHMNKVLEIINKEKKEEKGKQKSNNQKLGDVIEIHLPFKCSGLPLKNDRFIIYNMPGSNLENIKNHFEILKQDIDRQINVLPIFITDLARMDTIDNRKIIDYIDKKDDFWNIVIMNKADQMGKHTLECVEKAIVKYANNYALYNKCQQASIHLRNAINICVKSIEKKKYKQEKSLEEAKVDLEGQKKELRDQLEKAKEDTKKYNKELQNKCKDLLQKYYVMKKIVIPWSQLNVWNRQMLFMASNGGKRQFSDWLRIKEKWRYINDKGRELNKDEKWRLNEIEKYVNDAFNKTLSDYISYINKEVNSFWKKKSDNFKKKCLKIVMNTQTLTQEQEHMLNSVTLEKPNMVIRKKHIDLRKINAIRNSIIFIKDEQFDAEQCYIKVKEMFFFLTKEYSDSFQKKSREYFANWLKELLNIITEEIYIFNTHLNASRQKIDELRKEVAEKEKCRKMLSECEEYIDCLLKPQENRTNV